MPNRGWISEAPCSTEVGSVRVIIGAWSGHIAFPATRSANAALAGASGIAVAESSIQRKRDR